MLSNERVRRLMEVDREALAALMACAYADGARMSMPDGAWNDPHIRMLLAETRTYARLQIVSRQTLEQWNEEMRRV